MKGLAASGVLHLRRLRLSQELKLGKRRWLERIASLCPTKILSNLSPDVCGVHMVLLRITSEISRKLLCKVWCCLLWCQSRSAHSLSEQTHITNAQEQKVRLKKQHICNFIVFGRGRGRYVFNPPPPVPPPILWNYNLFSWFKLFAFFFFFWGVKFYIGVVFGEWIFSLPFIFFLNYYIIRRQIVTSLACQRGP